MTIVLAPNAFKECLSAIEVATAIEQGIRRVNQHTPVVKVPLADGGDGTTEALVAARQGTWVELEAHDPLMRPVQVQYGLIEDGRTAVMEMASVSGLWRLHDHEKNPLYTTTYGTGEMIADALQRGVDTIILGIGGSATNDAGLGMAQALGYQLFDEQDQPIEANGQGMLALHRIDTRGIHPRLHEVKIYVACDVTNPLLGPEGAAPVYAPQKGASPEMIPRLEEGLRNVSQCWQKDLDVNIGDSPGGGAAGGLGAGLLAFCNAQLRPGFELIASFAGLDQALTHATLIVTGEGKMDASTWFGKVPVGVAQKAQANNIPVIGLAGAITGERSLFQQKGFIAVFSIVPSPMSLEKAINTAKENIENTTEQVIRLWLRKI